MSAQDIARLRDRYGLALTVYVPNFAYVERVPPAVLRRLRRDPLVRAIVPYVPEFKIDPSIADVTRPRPEGIGPGEDRLDAFLFDGGSIEQVRASVEALGAHDISEFDDRHMREAVGRPGGHNLTTRTRRDPPAMVKTSAAPVFNRRSPRCAVVWEQATTHPSPSV